MSTMDFYNCHHPTIIAVVKQLDLVAQEIERQTHKSHETAFLKAAFDFVRDEVEFSFMMDWTRSALTTLESRKGNCLNKASLLFSILKTKGCYPQVRFCVPQILVSEFCHRMAPDHLWDQFPNTHSPHTAVQVCLPSSQHWITMDPSEDLNLARGMIRYGADPSREICFEGNNDGTPNGFWNYRCRIADDIDYILVKNPVYDAGALDLLNSSLVFLRRFGKHFANAEETHRALKEHLVWQCPTIVQSPTHFLPPPFDPVGSNPTKPVGSNPTKSFYCNHNHPQVRALASSLRKQASNDNKMFAQLAFRWVRDRIRYNFQPNWSVPVEHTLAIQQAMCSTKACLLVALLRAGGLKAGFFLHRQDAGEVFLVPEWISRHYGNHSIHVLAAVQLEGSEWLKLDVYIDKFLGKSLDALNRHADGTPLTPGVQYMVHFDGETHACYTPDHENMKFTDSLDRFLSQKSRIHPSILQSHNVVLEFIRKLGPLYTSVEEVLPAMDRYMTTFYPKLVAEVKALPLHKTRAHSQKPPSSSYQHPMTHPHLSSSSLRSKM